MLDSIYHMVLKVLCHIFGMQSSRFRHIHTYDRGSYMSAHVLFILLNELRKSNKWEACRAFDLFFATSLIKSIIQEHECYILFII